MGLCSASVKCLLFVIDTLFLIAGAFLMYVGIHYIRENHGSVGQVNAWPAAILLTAAGVLILGGLIGFVGTMSEKKTCLGLFLVVLFSVLIVLASISGIMFARNDTAKNAFNSFLWKQFSQYGNESRPDNNTNSETTFNSTFFIDESQKELHCCGFHNYSDWKNATWYFNSTNVPLSCCKSSSNQTCTGSTDPSELHLIYKQGCANQLLEIFHDVYKLLNWTALALTVFVTLGIVAVLAVLYYKRKVPLGYSELSPSYSEI